MLIVLHTNTNEIHYPFCIYYSKEENGVLNLTKWSI